MNQLNSLGIDLFSIIVYTVNFGVIFFIISKYVSNPLIKAIDDRRNIIKSNISEAELLRKQIELEQKKLLEERQNLTTRINEELANIKKQAQKELNEQRALMQKKQEQLIAEAQVDIENKKNEIVENLKPELISILNIAFNKIASTKIPEKDITNSIEEAVLAFKNDRSNI